MKQTKEVVSYLGPNTALEGEIHSNGDLHIDGKFSGNIVCNGDLIIGHQSKVLGSIKARCVLISGYFKGDIDAVESLEIFETGHVEGDLKGIKLHIHEGGIYKGKVNMDVIQSDSIYEGTFQVIQK
ncbi:MAG: polymer-forming cytoskeletal protein [Candidatus Margulisiibacteriota bacterium]